MSTHSFTIKHAVIVCKPRELVWDYTQDLVKRSSWDPVIHSAEVVQPEPTRIVRFKALRNTTITCQYKHYDRPNKSALTAKEISSPLISSLGGTWSYDKIGKGTLWRQKNTFELKQHPLNSMMILFYKWYFKKMTRNAMNRARHQMEQSAI